MANKKISELPQSTQITSDDFLPLVDSGSLVTKQSSFQTVLDYVTGSTFNSLTVSYVSGTEAQFTSLTGTLEGDITGNAATVTNGVYTSAENTFTNNNIFTTVTASSIDVDTITAREYYTELVTASVIYESGSTKFGNTSDDTHQFTGSIFVDGNVSGSTAEFTNLSGNLEWSYIINEPTFLEGNQTITLSGDATGSGETSITIGDISASFIKTGTDGANLINLTASQVSNFTDDVRAQFVAGDNIVINGGEISASLASAGDVFLASDNTFTAVNTFNNHYVTASVGLKVGTITVTGDIGNVAIGADAHISNIIGQRNVAIGSNALENNTTNSNIGIGTWALRYNATGRGNVALGDSALRDSVDSWSNVAIGSSALLNLSGSNSETTQNTAVGASSLSSTVTGSRNTAVGANALNSSTDGSNNVALGHSAGSDLTSGSNNIFIGYQAGTGETGLENTVIIRTDQDVMRISDAGQLSASSFLGDGSDLTNLSASQISNFTSDVRSQFIAGDNITINDGAISASVAGGLGDVLSGSDTTFTAVNTFDNHYVTASVGISASNGIFDSITSSYYYSDIGRFDSSVASTGTSNAFILNSTNTLSGQDAILSLQNSDSEKFYVRYDGYVWSNSSFTVGNSIYFQNDGVYGFTTALKIRGNGSIGTTAVRVGNRNNSTSAIAAAIAMNLDGTPTDLVEFRGDGLVILSGSNTTITTTGDRILELDPAGTGSVRFNSAYKFPTADGTVGQALITDGNGQLSFSTISSGGGSGDALTGSDNTFTATNTFDNFYITASAGITGSDAKFTSLSGNLDWSYVINEPTFLTANETITLSGDVTGTGTTSIAVSNVTASYVEWSNVANVSNIQNSSLQYSSITINGTTFNLGDTNTIPVFEGDALTGSNNTFTAINTFNNEYITASVGITGSDAKFTSLTASSINTSEFIVNQYITTTGSINVEGDVSGSGTGRFTNLSGNLDWSYIINEPTTLSGYGITDAITNNTTETVSATKIFTSTSNEFTGSIVPTSIVETTSGAGIQMSGSVDISGSIVADIEIPAEITSTSYTVDTSDRGKTLLFNNASDQNITCSAGLNVGFTCTFIQMGSGQLILSAAGGASLLNRQSHTGSAGQYAAVSIVVVGSNQYLVAGDTV